MGQQDAVIIHAFASSAAAVGAGLAQLPGSDAPALVALQSAMILALASDRDVPIGVVAATEMVLGASATVTGRLTSQWLVGWMPGWGNALNAATAAAVTEVVGWAAVRFFESRAPPR